MAVNINITALRVMTPCSQVYRSDVLEEALISVLSIVEAQEGMLGSGIS
jgi:hypothetical protein